MIFLIDGIIKDTNLITYNDGLNFGRFDVPGLIIKNYSIEIEKDEFVQQLQDEFWRCLCEIREDDKATGEDSPFKKSGYKPLPQMFDHPDELSECITIWFDIYIFRKFIGYKDTFEYVINSTDEIKVHDSKVLIKGKCFKNKEVQHIAAPDAASPRR